MLIRAWLVGVADDDEDAAGSTSRLFECANGERSDGREGDRAAIDSGDSIRLNTSNGGPQGDERREIMQREIEICRREKALVERELALAKREIELLQQMQNNRPLIEQQAMLPGAANHGQLNVAAAPASVLPKVNLTAVADLLSHFNGDSETFETWEKQVKFLRAAYKLDEDPNGHEA